MTIEKKLTESILIAVTAVISLVVVFFIVTAPTKKPVKKENRNLKISAGWSSSGVLITNNEKQPLKECIVRLNDSYRAVTELEVGETKEVPYLELKNGNDFFHYLLTPPKRLQVSCRVGKDVLSAYQEAQ